MLMSLPALVLLSALTASPDSRLSEARQLAEEFQYDKAAKTVEAALQLPDICRDTLIGLYELLAIAHATLDRPARAREAFVKLLVIAPDHRLSKNYPPRIRTPYFEARAEAARLGPVSLTADPVTRVGGRVSELSVRVQDNPLFPARLVRFSVSEDTAPPRVEKVAPSASKQAVLVVDARALKWSAELLGERDIVLQRIEREEAAPPEPVAVVEPLPPPPPPPLLTPSEPPRWLRPFGIAVGALGIAALATGGVFGYLSADARAKVDGATTDDAGVTQMGQRVAAELDLVARRDALVADVLFVVGGVLAATGIGIIDFGLKPSPAQMALFVGPAGLGLFARF